MRFFLKLLNSRKFAVYLLCVLLLVLVLSSFLPNQFTMTEEQWNVLEREKPFLYWLSIHMSTPVIVRHPLFLALSGFLFLSTLTCTISRVNLWLKTREFEFEKERAFSFAIELSSRNPMKPLQETLLSSLRRRRWRTTVSDNAGGILIEAQKGSSMGFWGSVVFHAGMVVCFLAAPVTALTVFRGEFLITEGIPIPFREGLVSHEGKPLSALPDGEILVSDLRGVYAEGKFKVDFGGTMHIGGKDFPFSVNNPVSIDGYQFSLQEFGDSVRMVGEKAGSVFFDYFLNLRHPQSGDYFNIEEESLTLYVRFFPDFYREGGRVGSRTKEMKNPVILLKVLENGTEMINAFVRLGEEIRIGEYTMTFAEVKHWVSFVVVRERGVPVMVTGMVIGIAGLLVRFLSNERRMEMTLREGPAGTTFVLKGYSRYYPAFLEKEVREIGEGIGGGE